MKKLQVLEYDEIRVLTTQQLAEVYETETANIKMNFKNHKNRFIEGRDYFCLKGNELKEFKNLVNDIYLVDKRTPHLYLWTERGANRHSKILDTDKAWQQFDILEETYFKVKHDLIPQIPTDTRDILMLTIKAHEETAQRVDKLEEKVSELEISTTINSSQQNTLNKTAKHTVINVLGGVGTPAYEKLSSKLFSRIWSDYRNYFKLGSYRDTLKTEFEKAKNYLESWIPEVNLQLKIREINSQMSMKL